MKKCLLLLLILVLAIPLFAQLEVKEGSFKEVPGFVNINPDNNYQTDDNNLPFAVIKVRTENINDKQRRELKFSGNAGTFIMLEYKDGEVWVYLTAQYADYLKISHPDYSSIEFTLPFDLKPKCGYEMTLVNKAEVISNGWASLTITTTPENGADISLNGRPLHQTTPYTNNMIPAGKYDITVSKFGFEDVTKTIVINEGESTNFGIEMPYKYGKISIVSNPTKAIVLINDVEHGITPLTLDTIKYGTYEIKVKKNNWKTHTEKFEIQDDKILSFYFSLENYPDGAINGVFSVSSTNKVCFSQGNLQYHAYTKTWCFAKHQWDIIGNDNKNISSSYTGWIDLFGWGTGDKPTQNSTGRVYSIYKEWGNNNISNHGNNHWRTLTNDEWEYVFEKRQTNSQIRYAKAIVNGVNGIVLLPDNWDNNIYRLQKTNTKNSKYSSNKINQTDWMNKLEANGAVFLPAAGRRNMISVDSVNSCGLYWSSTPLQNAYAYYVDFNNDVIILGAYFYRDSGLSVRLVWDIE